MLLLISDGLGTRILCNFTKILSIMLNQKNKQTQIFWNKGYSSFFPQIFGICTYFWDSNYLEKNEENPGSTFHSRVIFQLIPQVKITKNSIFLSTRSVTKHQLLLLNGFLISVYIFDRNYHVIHLLPKISL